jgi:hypothetical protein
MAWAVPMYSRTQVKKAGQTYVDPSTSRDDRELALAVINNWRSAHGFPLNTMQMGLRHKARNHDAEALIAQRIKRLPSIRLKLERFPDMDFSRMQDIGGCRAVVSTVEEVTAIAEDFERSRSKHKLVRLDDYVATPKPSGYRGLHLVHSYYSDRADTYNGLRIETQVRSRLQHAWATAMETVGLFTQQALKSSRGTEDWLRFFALMSSELAIRERTTLVPDTPVNRGELIREIKQKETGLDVVRRLELYGATLNYAEEGSGSRNAKFFLLELDAESGGLRLRAYTDASTATDAYNALERATADDPNLDVVLVSVESLSQLRRAYPNYFLDTTVFLDALRQAIS